MARNPKATKKTQDRRGKSNAAGGRVRRGRPKICIFCSEHATWVDYKDVGLLRRFMSDRGRIKGRGATGTCAQHQRDVATAIKTARELALLPYTVRTAATEGRGGRGGRGPRGGPGAADTAAAPESPDTSADTAEEGGAATEDAEAGETLVADGATTS